MGSAQSLFLRSCRLGRIAAHWSGPDRSSGEQQMSNIPQFCCACGQHRRSRNIVMIEKKALTPGKGWGCVQCDLPIDGALAAICDDCAATEDPQIQFVFDGYLEEEKLIEIIELPNIPHVHDMTKHPEAERE